MNLTVFLCCKGKLVIEVTMSFTGVSQNDGIPFVNVCLTVFEVPHDNRTISKCQCCRSRNVGIGIQCNNNITAIVFRSYCFTDEVQTVDSTKCSVGRCNGNVSGTQSDFIKTVQRCLYGNESSFSIRNSDNRLRKAKCIWIRKSNGLFTDNFILIDELYGYFPSSTVGCKYTIFNSTHTIFCNSPFHILRNIYLCTHGISRKNIKGNFRTGSVIIIRCAESCTFKLTSTVCSRDNKERVSGRSFTTVGERTVDLQFFTGTF